jgi:DNA repair exonuclease SbcCD nuclease subunit
MAKAFVIGDPHFKVSNCQDTELMCQQILFHVRQLNVDFIVCLGDILDRHEIIHVKPLESATKFLFDLSQVAPLYAIIGNHDRPNNSNFLTTEHPFNALKMWNNTHIIDITTEAIIKNQRFIFVPYVPPQRFMEALEYVKDPLNGTTCIFAHQEFKGAKMGPIASIAGDEWNIDYPMVISGHIHDFDELQKNILYVGTPIQHSFGDKDDKCCIMATFGETIKYDKIRLDMPRKRIIHLTCKELVDYEVPDKLQKDHLKIVITGTTSEIQTTMKFPKIRSLQKRYKIAFKDIPMVIETRTTNIRRKGFEERILEKIGDDKKLKSAYSDVFT